MAQQATTYRINRLAKDLNLKSKDIIDLLAENGIEGKTHMAILEPAEFNLFMELVTSQNQISNLDEYVKGEAKIIPKKATKEKDKEKDKETSSAKSEKEKEKEKTKAKENAEKAEKVEKTEKTEKAEKNAEVDVKTEEKTSKVEAKISVSDKDKANDDKDDKAVKEVKVKEAKTEKDVKATESSDKTANEPKKSENTEKAEKAEKTEKVEKAEKKEEIKAEKAEGAVEKNDSTTDVKPMVKTEVKETERISDNRNDRSGNDRNGGDRNVADRNVTERGVADRNVAERNGKNRPQNNQNRSQNNQQRGANQQRNDSSRGGERQNNAQRPQRSEQKPQQQQQKNPTVQTQGRGQVEAPKKNRGPWQPAEGASTQPKTQKPAAVQQGEARRRTGNTRIVDTRSSEVDLSKYDEKLNSYVSDKDDHIVSKQKLKKKNNQAISAKDRDKEKRAIEKLRKEEIERQRRQQLTVQIPDEITVGELANRLKITSSEVIKKLMLNGVMATVNQTIDFDTAFIITEELGAKAEREVVVTIEDQLFEEVEDSEEDLVERSPVVCVMGHVDHGKTSLLDAIRHTRVTSGEAGGITQHIGAYRVDVNGKYITFLDTPGHEAFTAMRLRGAQATDIAIIVVAADDGIMPQTVEAINHAKAAGVEIIVAINKMDKPTANPDQVKQELTKYDLVPEEWGGDIMCVPVSAMTGMGIDDLLENVLLIAEVQEYKANPNRRASGLVIEAKLDKGRGPVATMLVQNGTLHTGDIVIAGTSVGRVRAMTDENGRRLKSAGPSVPVEITGLAEVPSAGDEFNAVEDERMARDLAEQRRTKEKEEVFRANARAKLDDMFAQIESGIKDFNIIVKADVKGSAEAVKASLQKITNEEVRICIIHSAVGGIIESDVQLAAASNAIIVGFNVRPDKSAIDMAERMGVEIRTYRVIYECIEEINAAMKGMLAPKYREELLGHAQVRQTIHVPNVGTIAGSYVQDGKIARNAQIRIVRDGFVIFEDKISSLRHFKEDRREMAQGYECGIGLERFNDIKEGDILECFQMVEIER